MGTRRKSRRLFNKSDDPHPLFGLSGLASDSHGREFSQFLHKLGAEQPCLTAEKFLVVLDSPYIAGLRMGTGESRWLAAMEAVPRKTTIRDVAEAAGVGVGTISRVLNSSSQVSRETRARVLKAIRRLGFRPNAQARRILRRRSETVCFLLSNRDFLHPFHARILQGVESYASGMKQHVFVRCAALLG